MKLDNLFLPEYQAYFVLVLNAKKSHETRLPYSCVPDPWNFGVDPDPRIHASD